MMGQRTKPGWYGTLEEVNDPAKAARWFLLGKTITAADVAAAARSGNQPAGTCRLPHSRAQPNSRV